MRACLCLSECVWVSLCVCVCVALHNFHANAASDDLLQSSFASCTPLPASLSSSLSPSLSCSFSSLRSLVVLALSLSTSCAFSFEPHFDCFSLSACFSCGSKLCHLCLCRKTLEKECLLRFFYYLFLLLPLFFFSSTSWRRFWVNVCLLVVVVAVVSCGIRVASHRICASRRSVQHCLRSVLLPNFDCIFSSFLTVCWSSISFFYIFWGANSRGTFN